MEPALSVPLVVLAVGVWLLEQRRRSSGDEAPDASAGVKTFGQELRGLGPELLGIGVLAVATCAALARGGHNGAHIVDPEDHHLMTEIQAEWPLLTTADSLLAMQAMLRFAFLASATLRRSEVEASPFWGEPLLLLFLAASLRVLLLAISPADVYHLDGPLGGPSNLAFEAASLALLARLAFHLASSDFAGALVAPPRLLAAAMMLALAGVAAVRNRLAIGGAEGPHLDALFSLIHLVEFLAAFALLARAALGASGLLGGEEKTPRRGGFCDFAHAVLPAQALLGAYFLLAAWGSQPLEEVQGLVGTGHPFELLQLAGVGQVGLYLAAASCHFSSASASSSSSSAPPPLASSPQASAARAQEPDLLRQPLSVEV